MRLLEECSTLYTGSAFRVSVIGAKLVCLSITSKQARVAPECCHAVQGWKWRCPLTHNLKVNWQTKEVQMNRCPP